MDGFFSRNFMGKWLVSKGWDFPAMLPEDINIDSQAMYIFCLIQDGCTMMYWCYWSSPCLVHVMQSHRCENEGWTIWVALFESLRAQSHWVFPQAAQRWGKSVRMSFSFMFIWKPPIFCWFPSASFSSNCVYVFFWVSGVIPSAGPIEFRWQRATLQSQQQFLWCRSTAGAIGVGGILFGGMLLIGKATWWPLYWVDLRGYYWILLLEKYKYVLTLFLKYQYSSNIPVFIQVMYL